MRIKDQAEFERVSCLLGNFPQKKSSLVGLHSQEHKTTLILQILDSIRRIKYLQLKSARARSASLHTPFSGSFEPLSGSVVLQKHGHLDDAYWLVYLATHFGKHKDDGWNLTEDFYGRFGEGGVWDWATASCRPEAVAEWIETIYPSVTNAGRSRRFGNHRKFETLKPGPKGTGSAIETYIRWIKQYGSHGALLSEAQKSVGQNPKEVFAFLYKELANVAKLGRLGKFDLLCNLSNLQIAPIYANSAYIAQSTGPKAGARLLFGNSINSKTLEASCSELAAHLNVSPQVIEDALCNWQKSPDKYVHFRG